MKRRPPESIIVETVIWARRCKMPFFSNLDDNSVVPDIVAMTPGLEKVMGPYHKVIMDSPPPSSTGGSGN